MEEGFRVSLLNKYRVVGVYSMIKTGGRRKMLITRVIGAS
jgi:hypothetical protein